MTEFRFPIERSKVKDHPMQNNNKRRALAVFLALLIMLTPVLSGCGWFVTSGHVDDIHSNIGDNTDSSGNDNGVYDKLNLLTALIKANSYYELTDEEICASLIYGFGNVAKDRYCAYYTAEEYAKLTAENSGDTEGIGISVIQSAETGEIQVISVIPESPAYRAGLLPGDMITHIGIGDSATSVVEIGYDLAMQQLIGKAGTNAEFTLRRGSGENAEILTFSITREHVESQSVTYRVCATNAKVGVIKITGFDLTTPPQFCAAMDSLITSGCEKFIFDLRYNGGGDLASITAVLSYILNEGDILIQTEDRTHVREVTTVKEVRYAQTSPYSTCNITSKDIAKYREYVKGKSAVLVNGGTASAAELFTICLMDYKISKIVGLKTYGKGSMQSIIPLEFYSSTGALKLTTRMYFPPISEGYNDKGITPDVVVDLDESLKNKNIYTITDAEDNQLQSAISAIGN